MKLDFEILRSIFEGEGSVFEGVRAEAEEDQKQNFPGRRLAVRTPSNAWISWIGHDRSNLVVATTVRGKVWILSMSVSLERKWR